MTGRGEATKEGTSIPGVSFRAYAPGDILSCARLARDAWPAGPATGSKDIELAGMEGYMEYSLDNSNWADIACTSEGVAGFLFGRIDGLAGAPAPSRSTLGEVPTLFASLAEHGGITRSRLGFVWSLLMTELKLRLNTPRSDAEIEMFIVDSSVRGKGVGGELLTRFLEAAKASGASLVTLYTDDLMSNWRFYERRGFRRVATFHDNITSHYSGMKARGIIYTLELRDTA